MLAQPNPPLRKILTPVLALVALLALASCQSVFSGLDTRTGAVSASAEASLAAIRTENGLTPLRADPRLERAAREQAAHMASAGRMSHDTGWRRDFAARMDRNGIGGAASENIAHGRFDTSRVIAVWMNSEGHRRNMLDGRFSRFGLAYATDPRDAERRYWAMVLGQ